MCTSVAWDRFFGRNLDLECQFGEKVVITPRGYALHFTRAGKSEKHYAMIGMATVIGGYPMYADAVNEKGLCIAGLNFPDNAHYPQETEDGKVHVAPFELPTYLLSQCASVKEAKERLNQMQLVGVQFNERIPLAPMHWHIADAEGSIVLECMRDGMHVHDNLLNVMTNNPPFDFHLTNVRQYMNLTKKYPENRFSEQVELKPFAVGFGAMGMPGDFSSASRFVKAAFLRANTAAGGGESGVAALFHLLDAVAMPDGVVETEGGRHEFTEYSSCMDMEQGIYYYKTYTNSQISAVDMHRENLDGGELKEYPLTRSQQIAWAN